MNQSQKINIRNLYPEIEAYKKEWLKTEDGCEIYVEQSGNPDGLPVLFVHGGPGGGTMPSQRRFFDPEKYHIILFDQRGCGLSKPQASLKHNTTWHLIADMEMIRKHLDVDAWVLFGGSWGSTLSLLYAQKFPNRVRALILRGIFLMRQRELNWFYGPGTGAIFPEAWERFSSQIPEEEHDNIIKAYYKRVTAAEFKDQHLHFACEWSLYEGSAVTLVPDDQQKSHAMEPSFALAFARIETHYFANNGFLECDNQILQNTETLKHIPTTLVQGRYDAICPTVSAWELKRAMPWAKLKILPVAGHSAFEPPMKHQLILATERA